MRASMTRRFSPTVSALLGGGLALSSCAGPKFTPDTECDSCEGGAAGVEDRAGRGGSSSGASDSGGSAGKGGSGDGGSGKGGSGKGGSGARAGSSGAGGGASGESGSDGMGGNLAGMGAGGGTAGTAGLPPAGGNAGVAGAVSGASGNGGSDPGGFPLTDVLDDFEKPELFGEDWFGSLDDFTVADGVLTCNDCPHAALRSDKFSASFFSSPLP